MDITFKSSKLKKLCEDEKKLQKKYGERQAKKIMKRLGELKAAESLHDISKLPQARLHLLTHNWKGHFAVDIIHPYRLILFPGSGTTEDLKSITAIEIITIEDYH